MGNFNFVSANQTVVAPDDIKKKVSTDIDHEDSSNNRKDGKKYTKSTD
jgi:hypothetical protein